MHIFKYNGAGGIDHEESNLFRTAANISNGDVSISRIIYFESDASLEDAADVAALPEFPQKYAAHPQHPQFKYYGNASIEPLRAHSKIWKATLEYSSSDPNATDINGQKVTDETPPWNLRPENIDFKYPETTIPFTTAYNNENKLSVPVRNAAGDRIVATKSVFNIQMSFSFATKKWDPEKALEFAGTLNKNSEKVCGLKLEPYSALLMPAESSYVRVYENGSKKIKWEYWNVNITILIDSTGMLHRRFLLNVGDRAKFKQISLSQDKLLSEAGSNVILPETKTASQICSFRLTQKSSGTDGKADFDPTGDLVFCSWEQYLAARKFYLDASTKLVKNEKAALLYQLQCEQHQNMPLDENGYLLTKAIQGHNDYDSKTSYLQLGFQQYPAKSWNSLNLPKKGIK